MNSVRLSPERTDLSALSTDRIESQLEVLLPSADLAPQPLHRAMRHAVFSGGKRLRPRLLLAAAASCRSRAPRLPAELLLRAACAVELVHSASLVHDDLPCFDDADERRGRPTVHRLYGEPIAVLVGDALLCLAFEVLLDAPPEQAGRASQILRLLATATGSREGVIGGQSIELGGVEFPSAPAGAPLQRELLFLSGLDACSRYHAMKSAALFKLATEAGALALGEKELAGWAAIGQCFGLAYQLVDDLYDCLGAPGAAGKAVGRDAALERPNAVLVRGEQQTRRQADRLVDHARRLADECAPDPAPIHALFDQLVQYMHHLTGGSPREQPEPRIAASPTAHAGFATADAEPQGASGSRPAARRGGGA